MKTRQVVVSVRFNLFTRLSVANLYLASNGIKKREQSQPIYVASNGIGKEILFVYSQPVSS